MSQTGKLGLLTQHGFVRLLHKFDKMDMDLLHELSEDGTASIPMLAKKMSVNSSVLYSRIKRLKEKKVIKKFTIDVDDSVLGIKVRAIVGINLDPKNKDAVSKGLLKIPEVLQVTEVTGRFDMLVNVHTSNLDEIHRVSTDKIGVIDGVHNTETFIELQNKTKPVSYSIK